METLAEKPAIEIEQAKTFDITASVKRFQYDLFHFGEILPETRERVRDEELSLLCEGINRASKTSFILEKHGDDLVYFDQGEWRPYSSMLESGYRAARAEFEQDPRLKFKLDRAADDRLHAYKMRSLRPGEVYSWYSPYPAREALLYGPDFIKQAGFNPERRLGFLYQAIAQPDGSVKLESQTVDHSEPGAFGTIDRYLKYDPAADLDTLTSVYDGFFLKKYGLKTLAGRTSTELQENVWPQLQHQTELISYFLKGFERLARLNLSSDELKEAASRHTYGVWATFKNWLDHPEIARDRLQELRNTPNIYRGTVTHQLLEQEVAQALKAFTQAGKIMVSCGGSIELQQLNINEADPADVFDSIFGKPIEKYGYTKRMYCVVCQAPPKDNEPKKMCGPCGICKHCDQTKAWRK